MRTIPVRANAIKTLGLGTLVGAVAVTALAVAVRASAQAPDAAGDIRTLVREIERVHPNPYHSIPGSEFRRAADELVARAASLTREQQIVETMRLLALLGEREGHSGIHTLDTDHARPLRSYPLRLWRFPEGYYVLRAPDPSLVGARLVAVAGLPVAEVEARVRPLVPHDNESSRSFGLPFFLVCAEVLRGLGITAGSNAATFTFATRAGAVRDVTLAPVTAQQYLRLHPLWPEAMLPPPQGMPRKRQPLYLRLRRLPYGITPLRRGTAVYVAYNQTTYPGLLPRRLLRLARERRVRRVVVDLRLNGGGSNTRYGALLAALRNRVVNRPGRLAVLISRATFSAAGNFAAEVDGSTGARFFGEATGGSPNNYGTTVPVELPSLGVQALVSTEWIEVAPGDTRVAVEPDVPVPLTAADFFAGRDPVLAAALR